MLGDEHRIPVNHRVAAGRRAAVTADRSRCGGGEVRVGGVDQAQDAAVAFDAVGQQVARIG
jgi:hypothetical protein